MNDLTIIYYSANRVKDDFLAETKKQLLKVAKDIPIVSVTQKPMDLGDNICVGDIGYYSLNIFKQALIGVKRATTKYVAMAEDDVLYSPNHFSNIPTQGVFSYNTNVATIYTWDKAMDFIFKGKRVFHSLICERDLFIEAFEERFAKYPDAIEKPDWWTEPGKAPYEKNLGVTVRSSDTFQSGIANIVFCTPDSLGFRYLGYRKKLGDRRFKELPYWGNSEEIIKIYK